MQGCPEIPQGTCQAQGQLLEKGQAGLKPASDMHRAEREASATQEESQEKSLMLLGRDERQVVRRKKWSEDSSKKEDRCLNSRQRNKQTKKNPVTEKCNISPLLHISLLRA